MHLDVVDGAVKGFIDYFVEVIPGCRGKSAATKVRYKAIYRELGQAERGSFQGLYKSLG